MQQAPLNTACHCTGTQRAHSASYPQQMDATERGPSRRRTRRLRAIPGRGSAARRANPGIRTDARTEAGAVAHTHPRTDLGALPASPGESPANRPARRVALPSLGLAGASRTASAMRVTPRCGARTATPSHCRRERITCRATTARSSTEYPNYAIKRSRIAAKSPRKPTARSHVQGSARAQPARG